MQCLGVWSLTILQVSLLGVCLCPPAVPFLQPPLNQCFHYSWSFSVHLGSGLNSTYVPFQHSVRMWYIVYWKVLPYLYTWMFYYTNKHMLTSRLCVVFVFLLLLLLVFVLPFFLRQPHVTWNLLCRPGWPRTQRSTCLCLWNAEIKDVCYHTWLCV